MLREKRLRGSNQIQENASRKRWGMEGRKREGDKMEKGREGGRTGDR